VAIRLTLCAILAVAQLLIVPVGPAKAAPPRSHYDLHADVDYDQARVRVDQVVRYHNTTGQPLDRVVFQVTPAGLGAFTLTSASVPGQPVASTLNGSVLELSLPATLPANGDVEMLLSYDLELPPGPGRLGVSHGILALGNWFPILAPRQADWDRHQYTEIGDPFFSEMADFELRLTTSTPLVLAAGGELLDGDDSHFHLRASNVRDFALSLSPHYRPAETEVDGTLVRAYTLQPERSQIFADTAAKFLRWYGARLGPYSYASLAVAEVDLPPVWTGMEYPGLIFITLNQAIPDPFEGSATEDLIGHETAHQWFYGLIGTDQVNAPWLDESFAELLPLLYYRDTLPDQADAIWDSRVWSGLPEALGEVGPRPLNSSVYDFPDNRAYFTIVYRLGASFLNELRQTMGDTDFWAALADEVRIFRGKLTPPLAVLDLFQQHTQANLQPLIARYFSYPSYADPTPFGWRLELPRGTWRGTAVLAIDGGPALERMELWLDDRLVYAGPVGAINLGLDGVEPGDYLLLARVHDRRGVTFERAERVGVSTP